ncbi:MAG: hypothetical protein ABR991_13115 [Terracidiphilus sp.]
MNYLWFLPMALLAVSLFAIWRVRRLQERALITRIQTVIQPSIPDQVVTESAGAQARQMKYISIDEFKTILSECSDLIVVDLRADAPSVPFPIPTAFVLPVSPNELDTTLEMLPADRSVAFCGASNLNIFMIITSPCMEGSAPLYVLEGDFRLAEVA